MRFSLTRFLVSAFSVPSAAARCGRHPVNSEPSVIFVGLRVLAGATLASGVALSTGCARQPVATSSSLTVTAISAKVMLGMTEDQVGVALGTNYNGGGSTGIRMN